MGYWHDEFLTRGLLFGNVIQGDVILNPSTPTDRRTDGRTETDRPHNTYRKHNKPVEDSMIITESTRCAEQRVSMVVTPGEKQQNPYSLMRATVAGNDNKQQTVAK